MEKKIAFIGCGNMGQAILNGLIASGQVAASNIYVYTPTTANVSRLQQQFGIIPAQTACQAVQTADIIFAAVKPHILLSVMADLTGHLPDNALIVSVAAGVTLAQLSAVLGSQRKIIRAMPNTPALVNAAMTSVSPNANVNQQEISQILTLFRCCGEAELIDESLIHAVIGVSGSAPAYVFMFIEAMADAAVLGGMSRQKAYRFAAQAVMGAAKMVLETGSHPGLLKDQVCSPAGTTIEAVRALENHGLRAAVISAISKCMEKSRMLSQ